MNALNSILIEGNVLAAPEKKESARGTTVCNFRIVTSRFYQQDDRMEEEKSVFDVESWAKLAEACADNLSDGRGVRVVGRIKQCEDGKVKIIAEHVAFNLLVKKSS